jgi:predicted Zn finger-like uncharacterized protein
MTIHATCPGCGASYKLRDEIQGKKVRCTDCQQTFVADPVAGAPEEQPVREGPAAKRKPPRRKRRAPKEKGSPILLFSLCVLAVLVVLGGLRVLGYFMFKGEVQEELTDVDRGVLLTAGQLDPKLTGSEVDPGQGSFRKVRRRWGSYELTYRHGTPTEAKEELYVGCLVDVSPREADAQVMFIRASAELSLGTDWEGISEPKKVPNDKVFRWGDESKFVILRQGNADVGNIFVARKGRRVIKVVLVGVSFRDGAGFSVLLTPVLQRFEKYNP